MRRYIGVYSTYSGSHSWLLKLHIGAISWSKFIAFITSKRCLILLPPLYTPKVMVCFSWPTISATTPSIAPACSHAVTKLLRKLWKTLVLGKPILVFSLPKRFPTAFSRDLEVRLLAVLGINHRSLSSAIKSLITGDIEGWMGTSRIAACDFVPSM